MSRRTFAAAAIAIGGLLITPQVLPASASTSHGGDVAVSQAPAKPLIQGVVIDQFGHPVDNVDVQATKGDGTPQASAITYASDREDGPQHGYFWVEVTKGTFTLTLSRTGYKTEEYGPFEITKRGQRLSLGEIEIAKKLPDTTTDGNLVAKTITTKQSGAVDVVVSSKATSRPTGKVEVREGRKVVGEATLKTKNKGKITVELDSLSKGSHTLKLVYLGSTTLKASTSAPFTLKVIKSKH